MKSMKFNNHISKRRKIEKYESKHPKSFLTDLNYLLRLNPSEKINYELLSFARTVSPRKEEIAIRKYLISQMKETLLYFLDSINDDESVYEIHPFGSSVSDLFLPSSDIDILILKKGNKRDKATSNGILSKLSLYFKKNQTFIDPGFIFHIKKARVPVLKVRSRIFGIEFDIIVNNENCLLQSNYINEELENKPYLRSFCLILKFFLKSRKLSDSHTGGLCSYAQFLLLLHFFELHPLVQKNIIDPIKNIGVIFLDFFQYFGFNFTYDGVMICNRLNKKSLDETNVIEDKKLKLAEILPRDIYLTSQYGKNIGNTKQKNESVYIKQITSSILSLRDPVQESNDVGDNCSNFFLIKEVFQYAYRVMSITLSEDIDYRSSLIDLWIKWDPKTEKARKEIIEKYRNYEFAE